MTQTGPFCDPDSEVLDLSKTSLGSEIFYNSTKSTKSDHLEDSRSSFNKSLKSLDKMKDYAMDKIEALFSECCQGKQVVFFLDYDGTLSPLVEDPDKAFMPPETREVVKMLSSFFPTAIVSGRNKEKVYNFVKIDGIFYAGSHGMDISGPTPDYERELNEPKKSKGKAIKTYHFEIPENHLEDIKMSMQKLGVILQELLERFNAANSASPVLWIEDNKYSFSIHYRLTNKQHIEQLESEIDNFLLSDLGRKLKKGKGKRVFELKPDLNWHKGKAVKWILEVLKLSSQESSVVPIYIGDDVTDEDAFVEINPKFNKSEINGIPIIVSDKVGIQPEEKREESERIETFAEYYLKDCYEVKAFLEKFVILEQQRISLAKEV